MRFVLNTAQEQKEMLQTIGVNDLEELFADLPLQVRLNRPLNLPGPLAEPDLLRHFKALAEQNSHLDDYACFLGAGAYDHYAPVVIDQLLLRSEFYTAYTPYQPEISQGTLQAIFEYQSMICALTGLDVANASLYDGASALAEAAVMALAQTQRNSLVISRTVHPEYRETLLTYLRSRGVTVDEVPYRNGIIDLEALTKAVNGETAAVVIQQPNFFGCLEPVAEVGELARKNGALYVVAVDPVSLGLLEAPGKYGADIAVGEGQSLGNQISFGGPYLGFLACREELVRRLPGRLVGQTVDTRGRRGFVLTLQAREQHIRREKATSNICSNEALCALAATIYLSLVGKQGFRQVAGLCLQKAHYACELLTSLPGVRPAFNAPFFKEFAVQLPVDPEELNRRLLRHKIIGGLPLKRFYPEENNGMLFCVTENRTKEEIDRLAAAVGEIIRLKGVSQDERTADF